MKVLVGMSGGIDSSVAAALIKEQGHEVEGITMLIWKKDSPYPAPASSNSCYNPEKEEDIEEIRRICRTIGIEHRTVDCSDLYESTVLDNFRSEYLSGRTPNPCMWCNQKIKFGAMVEYARAITDFDIFATGHYARVEKGDNGRYQLKKAFDIKKDQSYFLSRLSQEQLSSVMFPLGSMLKSDVRKIDEKYGFHMPGADESQDFYGGDYTDLLGVKDREGEIVDIDGRVLGHHKGFWHYTIGQRKGLGIAYSEPLYVIGIDSRENRVVVGTANKVYHNAVKAGNIVFSSESGIDEDRVYSVKIRSTSPGEAARIRQNGDMLEISFLSPVKAPTPGQGAVVYDGDRVIASAFIEG